MNKRKPLKTMLRGAAGVAGLASAAYAAYVATTWLRYGHQGRGRRGGEEALLDRFMPVYDVVERHRIRVAAPPSLTLAAACDTDLGASAIVRAIFRARELLLGATSDAAVRPGGLLARMRSFGWGELAHLRDREVVMGAVTQPWQANVVFRPLSPEQFVAFAEPGFVKIAWTLRADPLDTGGSVFRTETRAVATDAFARRQFRRYWSLLSPGIIIIRWMMLAPVKAEAERRARSAFPSPAG